MSISKCAKCSSRDEETRRRVLLEILCLKLTTQEGRDKIYEMLVEVYDGPPDYEYLPQDELYLYAEQESERQDSSLERVIFSMRHPLQYLKKSDSGSVRYLKERDSTPENYQDLNLVLRTSTTLDEYDMDGYKDTLKSLLDPFHAWLKLLGIELHSVGVEVSVTEGNSNE